MASTLSIKDLLPLPGSSNKIPRLGFGVYESPPSVTTKSVSTALKLGYRHIDTAQYYANESEVGKAIKDSGIPRSELFVVTKILSPVDGSVDKTLQSLRESVKKIGDYVDLFLIHTPTSGPEGRKTMWTALEKLKEEGLTKDIGVSNFGVHHLKEIKSYSSTIPACNQIELHPFCQQPKIVSYCQEHNIVITAYAPVIRNQRSDTPVIVAAAKAHDKKPTQVLLKWSIQRGFCPLPKSDTESRIKENMELDGWELTEEEMSEINKLDEGAAGAICPHPVGCA